MLQMNLTDIEISRAFPSTLVNPGFYMALGFLGSNSSISQGADYIFCQGNYTAPTANTLNISCADSYYLPNGTVVRDSNAQQNLIGV